MGRFILRRLVTLVPTMLLASFVVFALLQLIPGDPAVVIAGEYATPERLDAIREQLGLNESFFAQYIHWLVGVLQGDLGTSLLNQGEIVEQITRRMPATLTIVVGALIFSLVIGLPLGVAAARRAERLSDSVITGISTLGVAMPNFWLGMLLVAVFSLKLDWLPATGSVGITENPWQAVQHALLPSIALGAVGAAELARQTRSALIGVLNSDFIRTHRAKGLSENRIMWVHGLRSAGIPIATTFGLLVNRFLGATVVIEAVFGIPGLGSLIVASTFNLDFPVVQGVVLVMVVIVVFVNFLVDLSYRLIDPRIRT
ncbi:ABC transporter permease [Ilumatobacter sp.]|uniref:ABC transporter permease n=1 Tax=Ilumatobacter sp. TaxID=1967498 RepID=UPI0037534015